jgi:hypothetical protein
MSPHERELTISPDEGSVVWTGKHVTDTFRLKKKSDSAKFAVEHVRVKPQIPPPPAGQLSYSLTYSGITLEPLSLDKLKHDVATAVPLTCHSIDISVIYKVPPGPNFSEGQSVVTELTASLTHEKHAETITTSVFHVVGTLAADPVAELGVLAGTLYADYEEFDTLPDGDIQKTLKNADTTVASIVNGTASIDVKPNVFAEALAIHDLVDDLYGKLLEKAQPPERVDVVP